MTAERFLSDANALSAEITREERSHARRVETLKRRRRRAWLKANRAGLTYDEIVERSGVSDGYFCREMRTAKAEGPETLRDAPTTRRTRANGRRSIVSP